MANVLIKNALIVDGTGAQPYAGHLQIAGDRIKAVVSALAPESETMTHRDAERVIDAQGLAVAPGFIDCHSHFDWVLPLPDHQKFLYPLVEQGVTTVVTGNCGFSPAPVDLASQALVHEYTEMLIETLMASDSCLFETDTIPP